MIEKLPLQGKSDEQDGKKNDEILFCYSSLQERARRTTKPVGYGAGRKEECAPLS